MSQLPPSKGAILLADDNPVNTVVARTMLEDAGYHVATAQNGRVALAVLAEQAIDLVLLDCRMPIVDGYTLARTVREGEAAAGGGRMPIIAVTGDVSDENRQDCLAAGMDDVLAKPFEPTELTDIVARWYQGQEHSAPDTPAAHVAVDHGTVGQETVVPETLNRDTLGLIRNLDDSGEVLARLIGLFLADVIQDLISVRHGAAAPAKKAAHNIKSSAANMGAMKLAALCQDLETLLDTGTEDGREAVVQRIDAAFDEVRPLLEGELERQRLSAAGA